MRFEYAAFDILERVIFNLLLILFIANVFIIITICQMPHICCCVLSFYFVGLYLPSNLSNIFLIILSDSEIYFSLFGPMLDSIFWFFNSIIYLSETHPEINISIPFSELGFSSLLMFSKSIPFIVFLRSIKSDIVFLSVRCS